jgi:1-phosphofructokinase family hexose kinase
VIATITLNPALDVTITVDELDLGGSQRTPAARRRAGGKGVNVARVLAQQGIPATVLACVGGSVGEEFAGELSSAGLGNRLVWTDVPTRVSRTIHETTAGRATVLNEAGTRPAPDAVVALADLVDTLPGLRALVIAGSLPPGLEETIVAELITRARRRGAATVVDASGGVLIAAAEAGATLLKPNADELRTAAGPDTAGPVAAAHTLLERGAGTVVVTRGEDGMLAIDRRGVRRARLARVLRGNPTGAGDAATAALAAHLAHGVAEKDRTLDDDALVRAVAWSASAVLAPLAGELDSSWTELAAEVVLDHHDPHDRDPEETTWLW